jgi:outer membrane receptor protein involved in Fe transport
VINYITYSANSVKDPTGAVLLNTLNTPLAELRGFEAFNSFDLTSTITPFASAHYVYGMDQTIHQPLTQIPPLQGFAGVRFHDGNGGARWGLEVFATMTREQNRPGVIRVTDQAGQVTQIERRVGGWTTGNMRGYWNVNRNLIASGGINNIFDRNYIQYLSLQTLPLQVLSPGISPYMSLEWIY